MGKYREIVRVNLKSQLVWRADAIFNMLFAITKIIFAWVLWGIIFQKNQTVGGFTFHTMLSYYIISSFLTQIEMSDGISGEVSYRIRNGTFSKYMVIPVNIEGYFIAQEIGVVLFYVGFDALAAILWVVLFRIQLVVTTNVPMILCAIIMVLLGLLFMVQLNYYLGLLALKYEDVGTFLMIKNNFMAVITGSIIPLTLLPEAVINVMKFFPFYYVTYLPSMLLIGRCENEAVKGVFILAGWCLLMEVIIRRTYESYRYKFDGVGI